MKRNLFFMFIFLISQITFSQWTQVGSNIDGENPFEGFGYSISLSTNGSIVAIGAPFNDITGNNSGQVEIYQYDAVSNIWQQLGNDIPGMFPEDEFGSSVSLSANGSIVAIGAPYRDVNGSNSGHVRIFQYDAVSNMWQPLGADIEGQAMHNQLGRSVSLNDNGNQLAVGIDNNVRIYEYDAH